MATVGGRLGPSRRQWRVSTTPPLTCPVLLTSRLAVPPLQVFERSGTMGSCERVPRHRIQGDVRFSPFYPNDPLTYGIPFAETEGKIPRRLWFLWAPPLHLPSRKEVEPTKSVPQPPRKRKSPAPQPPPQADAIKFKVNKSNDPAQPARSISKPPPIHQPVLSKPVFIAPKPKLMSLKPPVVTSDSWRIETNQMGREMCSIEPSALKEFESMVRRDFKGLGPTPTDPPQPPTPPVSRSNVPSLANLMSPAIPPNHKRDSSNAVPSAAANAMQIGRQCLAAIPPCTVTMLCQTSGSQHMCLLLT
ncbi:hypothetical protein BDM02DRAFT_3131159 [Thelephora ganbajun]|uniref:Uncharacterized protein n=1 Tax=Thelephora ganbajun TaxID=370292 RepID=A0ACB6Z6W9_THEGA|nr:hypothetical protein BDM02DRAFT_3131159 [Thelephora ganbajun]